MVVPIFIFIVIYFITDRILKKRRDNQIGWKAQKESHNTIIYSERVNGKWEQIEILRAYDSGSFFPDFKNETDWKNYPSWAQDRDKIIQRVSRRFPDKKKSEIDDIGSHL